MRTALLFAVMALGAAAPAAATPGALDTSFGRGGVAITEVAGARVTVGDVFVGDGGRVIVTGALARGSARSTFVARYLPTGVLDANFGGGIVEIPLAADTPVEAPYRPQATITSGGAVVVAMGSRAGIVELARVTAGGTLDTTFGIGGRVAVRVGDAAYGPDVTVEPDGRFVVSAFTSDRVGRTGDHGVAIARLTPTGNLDATFGNGGVAVWMLSRSNSFTFQPTRLVRQAGAYVVGTTVDFVDAQGISRSDMVVVRFTHGGTRDLGFGAGGQARIETGANRLGDIVLQRDGRLLVVGGIIGLFPARDGRPARSCCVVGVIRLTPNGQRDGSFGSAGSASIGRARPGEGSSAAVDGVGRIVVTAAMSDPPYTDDFALGRFTAHGRPDVTFDVAGQTWTDVTRRFAADAAVAVALTTDGRIVVAGETAGRGATSLALARYRGGTSAGRPTSLRIALGAPCRVQPCRVRPTSRLSLHARALPSGAGRVVLDVERYDERGLLWELRRQAFGRRRGSGRYSVTLPRGTLVDGRWRVQARTEATAAARRGRSAYVFFSVR